MKYVVALDSDAIVHATVGVEAENEEQAKERALGMADDVEWYVGDRHADIHAHILLRCSNCGRIRCLCDKVFEGSTRF